jgi:general secretion pathway protein C
MDVFVKKYFWVVTLVVIGLCSTLSGRTVSHLIEQSWLTGEETSPASLRRAPPPIEKTRTKEVDAVVRRDVFCSTCAPIAPSADNPASNEAPDTAPRKSDLQLELVSTMVVPSDDEWSMAVIRDLGGKEKDAALYRKGSALPGGAARVLRVVEKKVYLTNNNRVEYIDIEGAAAPAAPSAPVALNNPAATGDPLDADIKRGVRCNGANCEIDRSLVDKMLSNTALLATAARFVPSIKDGRPNGFKLYAIRPNSIFAAIQLQNGDTVKSINGMEMSSPDQALGVYTKVRTATHLTVVAERRNETVTLDYTIR